MMMLSMAMMVFLFPTTVGTLELEGAHSFTSVPTPPAAEQRCAKSEEPATRMHAATANAPQLVGKGGFHNFIGTSWNHGRSA